MSTARTGRAQHARLRSLGLDVAVLPTLVDLDTVDDLPAIVTAGPATRTARLAAHLGLVPLHGPAPLPAPLPLDLLPLHVVA